MKGLLRRLHLASSSEDPPDCADPKAPKIRYTLSDSSSSAAADSSRAFSGVLGLLRVAKDTLNQAGSLKRRKEGLAIEQERKEEKEDPPANQRNELNLIIPVRRQTGAAEIRREAGDRADNAASPASSPASRPEMQHTSLACTSSDSTLLAVDAFLKGTPGIYRTQTAETAALQFASDQAVFLQDEELQVRVAMALSVRDDPEAATIETVKDATRGADSLLLSSSGQLLAYRYWKYSALSYKDKIVDGFYDVYSGVPNVSIKQMPSLTTLKEASISKVMWDAVMVNRAADPELVRLEQKAIALASEDGSIDASDSKMEVVKRIAKMVADQMGGSVVNADSLLEKWKASSAALRLSAGSVVLPLGQLHVGLGHHRALLFKVLADAVGMPCQLIKGKKYALDDETALTVIKDDSEKEYIIDLMAVPGSLYPYDTSLSMAGKCLGPLQHNLDMGAKAFSIEDGGKEDVILSQGTTQPVEEVRAVSAQPASKPAMLRRSPSWTEGVGRQSAKESKVKDVSQYMINAAKDNPFLAQKLHDVLIESGVKAPPDLFSEKSQKQLQDQMIEELKIGDDLQKIRASKGNAVRQKQKSSVGPGRPVFVATYQPSSLDEGSKEKLQRLTSVEGLGARHPLDILFLNVSPGSSPNSSASSGAAAMQSTSPALSTEASSNAHETFPSDLIKGPVAAAAATAAVVASSMLVAATKSEGISDTAFDVPVAMAATATAAVVAATTAVVGRRIELPFLELMKGESFKKGVDDSVEIKYEEAKYVQQNSDHSDAEDIGSGHAEKHIEDEKMSDKSTSSVSVKSDGRVFDDVAECEILWEDLVIGERIGIGSYGEVYRGDWHGTEVAAKKFLDQDISGDALLEFASEVRLMKRMRHPNVVLFMGAVMQQPNLSIVTEFLPRGSLYRLIHRSNSQLDERRRVRMALDVARGMNYLHNCVPVIVHRDLKSPNLLVDKNWVVKVCDFGLSRLKNGTFLSSKSTAGTPEWMAPEVLRNEPSNEKSDVYSFGVILWELATLQQPWAGMNPMQVVGAVGFQHRTLDIPSNLDPIIVGIIRECWHSNPTLRPSFAQIMNALKTLQKPIVPAASPKV